MQIDAHSVFADHWDTELVEEWRKADNEYGALGAGDVWKYGEQLLDQNVAR